MVWLLRKSKHAFRIKWQSISVFFGGVMQRQRGQSDPANRVWLAIALLGVIAIFVLFGLLLKKTEYSAGASGASTTAVQARRVAAVNVQPWVEASNTTRTVQVGNLVPESANFREQWHQSGNKVSLSSARAHDPDPCHEVADWQSGTYIDKCSRGKVYEAQTKREHSKSPDRAGIDQVIQSTLEN